MFVRFLILLMVAAVAARAARADDFFENKVRPVLIENCFKCHSDKQQKGEVRLDGPEFLKAAGDGSGPLIVPGKPAESRLIKAVRHEGSHTMPPGKKLADAAIQALTEWVQSGAKWPEGAVPARPAIDHWAFQPVRPPQIPEVVNGDWPASDLDRFVLAKLEAKKLSPSPAADKRTLFRRASFDLTGLPPTPEQIEIFLRDESADAFAKAVDRLLDSDGFGERWGRHWLDVARYSDTKGAVSGNEGKYPSAYTYRDWVVKAFKNDLPYDQFLLKQLAADHLTRSEGHPDLAALGFLTLGNKFDNSESDIINDQLDTIFRGMQGLTITCARCHDHKYDPISIKDYYSLFGVFTNSRERDVPIIATPADRSKYLTYAAELRARVRSLNRFEETEQRKLFGSYQTQVDQYLLAAQETDSDPKEAEPREDGLKQAIVNRYREFLALGATEHQPIFAPWLAFAKLEAEKFADEAGDLSQAFAENEDEEKPIHPLVAKLFSGKPPQDLDEVARRYGRLLHGIARKWQRTIEDADQRDIERPDRLADDDEDEIRRLLFGSAEDAPLSPGIDNLADILPEEKQQILERLRDAISAWRLGPDAPPMARVLEDPEEIEAARVFIRGRPEQPGDEVPRQFLAVLAGEKQVPFSDGTGRLELAKAIANKDNPLTARVWANRVWAHLIGRPLVDTSSDFGRRTAPPTHPELLDWLAQSLVDNGWSTKQLIRQIVLSNTYRQASADRPDTTEIDQDNTLLWRMNRKRLELEPLRDAMLVAAGNLDATVGGRAVNLVEHPLANRRALYLTVERGNLPGWYHAFDFANPSMTSAGRHETTVPQQALYLLNSPFAIEQARTLAKRAATNNANDEQFVRNSYLFACGREVSVDEMNAATRFLKAAALKTTGPQPPAVVWKYGVGKWDASKKKLNGFTPFAHFQDDQWRAAAEYPDAKLAYAALSAEGGHPGENQSQAVVRRWIAQDDGTVSIAGTLSHELPEEDRPAEADGVKGFIVANGKIVAAVDVLNKEAKTTAANIQIKKRQTIDFIIDPKTSDSYDSFKWRVNLTIVRNDKAKTEVGYDSTDDFRGPVAAEPPLSPREKLAQVLLMSNEFLYID